MKKLTQKSRVFFLSLSFLLFNYAFAQQTCNGSLLFDQTNDISVSLPPTNHYYTAVNGGYTWECWIMLNSVPGSTGNDMQLISAQDLTIYEDMYLGFGWHGGVQNRGSDSLVFKVDGPSSAWPVDLNCAWAPAGGFNVNQWYHVMGVADYKAKTKYLYVDCKLVDKQRLSVPPNTRVIPANLSACSVCGAPYSLDGYMDEVRIWDKALTQAEISKYCSQCLTGNEPNLFLYYRCNQVGALNVLDATSNLNNGAFVNPPSPGWSTKNAPVSGAACKKACTCMGSLDFDATNNTAVELPPTNQYYTDANGGYTWECWFKLRTAPGSINAVRPLISAIDWTLFEDNYFGFGWDGGWFDVGYDSLVFKVDGPSSIFPVVPNCAWAPAGGFVVGQWYHAAGVMDYNLGLASLYVNGVLVDSQNTSVTGNPRVIQTNLSSWSAGNASNTLDGLMDEVRIWDRALTAAEIAANYQLCRSGSETNLLLYYRCNQVGASNVFDGTGNGLDGTFRESAGWSSENAPVTGTCQKDCDQTNLLQNPQSKTTGIAQQDNETAGLKLYPNPSAGSIKVSSEQPGVLTVYSVTGAVLSKIDVQKDEHEVKLEGYKSGIYLYVFTSGPSITSGKLIIE